MTRKVFSGLEVSSKLNTDDDGNWKSLDITVSPAEACSNEFSVEEILAGIFDNECLNCEETCEECKVDMNDLEEATIEPGDTVKLKSGGPKMTVGSVQNDGQGDVADCYWFVSSTLNCRLIPVECLEWDDKHSEK